jgi:hypothetical protein
MPVGRGLAGMTDEIATENEIKKRTTKKGNYFSDMN